MFSWAEVGRPPECERFSGLMAIRSRSHVKKLLPACFKILKRTDWQISIDEVSILQT